MIFVKSTSSSQEKSTGMIYVSIGRDGCFSAAAGNGQPAFGLIALVSDIETDPDLTENSRGQNADTPGLSPHQFLDPTFRDNWESNPYQMPDEVTKMLPRTVLVLYLRSWTVCNNPR